MRSTSTFLTLMLLATVLPCGVGAVSLDTTGADSQVLIFPLFSTEGDNVTELTIRNHTDQGKALKVLTKDALSGRPTISINVYLKPGDAWNARLTGQPRFSTSITTEDESCTVPRLGRVRATTVHLDRSLNESLLPRSRLDSGYIEVFEMGEIPAELAGDCDAISQRFTDGEWSGNDLFLNDSVSAPGGGLSGISFIKDVDSGRTFALQPTGLADFSSEPMHTVSARAGRPSLANVMPPQAEVNGQTATFAANPINAVEAVLMTQQLAAEYHSEEDARAFASALVLLPTRPFHANPGFYRSFTASPFAPDDSPVNGNLVDNTGDPIEDLPAPVAGINCDRYTGAVNFVQLVNFFAFSHPCLLGDAEFFLFDDDVRGLLELPLAGTVTSDEGTVFNGLPAVGHMLQTSLDSSNANALGIYTVPMRRQ
ncbi:MAG: hypothetical protein AAF736_17765 [Pseudomonadota bacterium]